jgi:uncharacterized protein (DUF433 family)
MESLSDFEKMLPALSRGEKAQILKWMVRDLDDDFPGIDSRPDVCGGEPCIVRTRIPVWLLEQARRLGASEQALLEANSPCTVVGGTTLSNRIGRRSMWPIKIR